MSDLSKMLKTVVSSLFQKTACEMYPVKPARFYKNSRGSVQIDPPKCILCTLCEKRCPAGAIKVDRNGGTWEIDRTRCIVCNECVDSCRPKALVMDNQYTTPDFSKVINKVDIPKKEKKPAAPKAAPAKKAEAKVAPKKQEAKAEPKADAKKEDKKA